MTTRLFKYPCSYLIYSDAFDHLPAPVREYVYKRLWEVLTGKDRSAAFAHLTAADRAAILQILRETKSGLPPYWHNEDLQDLNGCNLESLARQVTHVAMMMTPAGPSSHGVVR